MTRWRVNIVILSIAFAAVCCLGRTVPVQAAEIQMQVQAAPAQSALSPTGKLLTIEDAIRIGLDNNPRIKSSIERVLSQQAVLGQQMSAYYPIVTMSNQYRATQSSTNGGAEDASESYSSQASFN